MEVVDHKSFNLLKTFKSEFAHYKNERITCGVLLHTDKKEKEELLGHLSFPNTGSWDAASSRPY
jgi:hypothetical protein